MFQSDLATPAQCQFIRTLISDRQLADGLTVKAALSKFDSMEATLTKPEASRIIGTLKQRPLRKGSKAAKVAASVESVPAGTYTVKSGTFVVSRPKGWTPEEGGWYFVKTADGQPVRRGAAYAAMTEIAASL